MLGPDLCPVGWRLNCRVSPPLLRSATYLRARFRFRRLHLLHPVECSTLTNVSGSVTTDVAGIARAPHQAAGHCIHLVVFSVWSVSDHSPAYLSDLACNTFYSGCWAQPTAFTFTLAAW